MIKAIETHYAGYRFRSRTEARWAIAFEKLGLAYAYESEGYDLGGVWYLPDFWIPAWDMFVEIKPDAPSADESDKCQLLAFYSGHHVMLIAGAPHPENHRIWVFTREGVMDHNPAQLRQCRRCPDLFLMWKDENGMETGGHSIGHPEVEAYMREHPGHECLDRWPMMHSTLRSAFNAAMSARFEYGEKGVAA